MLLALCDILDCQFTDLAVPAEVARPPRARKVARKKVVGGGRRC